MSSRDTVCLFLNNTNKILSKNRPENNLQTLISTLYKCFTTVLLSATVEYVTDMTRIYTKEGRTKGKTDHISAPSMYQRMLNENF